MSLTDNFNHKAGMTLHLTRHAWEP